MAVNMDPLALGIKLGFTAYRAAGLAGAFVLLGGALGAGFSGVAVNRYLKADLAKLH